MNVLISACLIGTTCRYDGKSAPLSVKNRFAAPGKPAKQKPAYPERSSRVSQRPKQGDGRKGQFAGGASHRKGVAVRSGRR